MGSCSGFQFLGQLRKDLAFLFLLLRFFRLDLDGLLSQFFNLLSDAVGDSAQSAQDYRVSVWHPVSP